MTDHPPNPDFLPDDEAETRRAAPTDPEIEMTRPSAPIGRPAQPARPSTGHVVFGPAQRPMKRRRRQRQNSPLYLPLWSLALMFVTVLVMAFGIVFVIANIGANDPEESGPIFVIITAEPTIARSAPPALSLVPASPTIPGEFDRQPDTDFSLTGPTLVPVVFTSTPESIAVGKFVIIYDVGLQQLNIRDSAGVTDSSIVFRGEEGERFAVIDGPVQADGLTWWMLQDPQNNTRTGWAASNYLIAQPQE